MPGNTRLRVKIHVSVPTVVYVAEEDRREIANLRSEPQAISFVALCLFLRLLLPPT